MQILLKNIEHMIEKKVIETSFYAHKAISSNNFKLHVKILLSSKVTVLWNRRYLVLARVLITQFFSNFEHFTIVWFSWNSRCLFISQFYILHYVPKLVVAPHFRLGCQKDLYFSSNFEHFIIVQFWWFFFVSFTILYCAFLSKN